MKLALGIGSLGIVWVVGAGLNGCSSSTPSTANTYEVCSPETCSDPNTECTTANVQVQADPFAGNFCTRQCASASDCPSDGTAYDPVCVIVSGASAGECFAGCPDNTNNECPYSETCATAGGGTFFCVP
jgi:hypothetical protein